MRVFSKAIFVLVLGTGLSSCDWYHAQFMNSLPFKGDPSKNPEVHVFLGIDGLSYKTVEKVQSEGYFNSGSWRLSKLITMFPGTSDASWTRILHTSPIGGYEFEHYDPTIDKIKNTGLVGYLCHAMPNFTSSWNFEPPYYSAFDYRANGYFHTAATYLDTQANLGESLDNLFTMLEGRAETNTEFTGYMLELDVLGHMKSPSEITEGLRRLALKIDRFKKLHPERSFKFTLLSDHGMDFVPVPKEHLVKFDDEMRRVGVEPVSYLAGRTAEQGIFALTTMHTRVTYLELHTVDPLILEVSRRVSQIPSVDIVVAHLPEAKPLPEHPKMVSFGAWKNGVEVIRFGYDPDTDSYYIPENLNRAALDFPSKTVLGNGSKWLTDDEAFFQTQDRQYPDFFYRVRTSFSSPGIQHPADILVSLKPSYASTGTELPGGANDLAMAAFHGALDAPGTLGTLFTEARELPSFVRSDNVLNLFPRLAKHLKKRGTPFHPGDPGAGLTGQ